MTEAEFALLQDKVAVWRRYSQEGNMDLRDYNGRAAAALTGALVERAALLAALKQLHLKAVVGTDEERHAALTAAWAAIYMAEGVEAES